MMNKTFKAIGIIGAFSLLFGGVFKVLHWPGASVMLIFGLVPVFLFLFAWLSASLKNVESSKEKWAHIILAVLLVVNGVQAITKIQHWPGSNQLALVHFLLLLLVFIPVYLIYLGSESNELKKLGRTAFFVLYLASTGLFLAKGGLGGYVMNAYGLLDDKIRDQTSALESSNNLMYTSMSDSASAEKLGKIKALSAGMSDYVRDLKSKLISVTEGIPKEAADTLSSFGIVMKDNSDVPTHLLVGNGEKEMLAKGAFSANELRTKLAAYREALLALAAPDRKAGLDKAIGLSVKDSPDESWENHYFFHNTLVGDLAILSEIQTNIRFAESEVICSVACHK
jgi:hypothetical protein